SIRLVRKRSRSSAPPISPPHSLRALRRVLPLIGAAVLLAGCGTGGLVRHGDKDTGKKLFIAKCAGCHTLAAAGATGTIGPNLDQLKPPFARAQRQVIHGGVVMPAFQNVLTSAQIKAVAKFVASHAGKK